jgi:hypothetical protein
MRASHRLWADTLDKYIVGDLLVRRSGAPITLSDKG